MSKLVSIYFFLKYKLRNNLPKKVINIIPRYFSNRQIKSFLEQHKSFGKLNPDKTFYVIRRRPPGWGFYSNIFFVLEGLELAQKNGFIPVVDMENYWVGELSSLRKINGTSNAWCYFFNQVSGYSLEEVYKSKNVILSNGSNILGKNNWLTNRSITLATSYSLLKNAKLIIDKYLSLNNETLKFVEEIKNGINWDGGKTLGVFIRGTPYFQNIHFPDNTIPKLEFFISEVKSLVLKKSIKCVYVSTEDYRVYNFICSEFKDIMVIPSIRYDTKEKVMDWEANQKMTHVDGLVKMNYEKTLLYLAEINLLIDCVDFIGTFSNASAFVLAARNLDLGDNYLVLQDQSINIKAEAP
jgi:hypothetical protein